MPAPEDVLCALGRKYSAEILEAADSEKSAQELSDALDVPIATCYRRINELHEAGLLSLSERRLTDEHRRISVYRRQVDGIHVDFDQGLSVETDERSEVADKLDDVWRRLGDS
jgi:predicted ArsR family transcriptional regulator